MKEFPLVCKCPIIYRSFFAKIKNRMPMISLDVSVIGFYRAGCSICSFNVIIYIVQSFGFKSIISFVII